VIAVGSYGQLFVPPAWRVRDRGEPLTVLTYNALAYNPDPAALARALRSSGADVIGLQELSEALALQIRELLLDVYPYQILAPEPGVAGMGVISRFPLRPLHGALPGAWLGRPQVVALEIGEQTVRVVNVHAISVRLDQLASIEPATRERERQAATLAAYVAASPDPVVVMGDFNTGDQSAAYRTLRRQLGDAWRAAGWGLGNTFPGAGAAQGSRPVIAGVAMPEWTVRIDYIFYSCHWQAQSARLGPWDGHSDHHPVAARLALNATARCGANAE